MGPDTETITPTPEQTKNTKKPEALPLDTTNEMAEESNKRADQLEEGVLGQKQIEETDAVLRNKTGELDNLPFDE